MARVGLFLPMRQAELPPSVAKDHPQGRPAHSRQRNPGFGRPDANVLDLCGRVGGKGSMEAAAL